MDDAIEFFEAAAAVLHEVRGRAEIAGGVRGPVERRALARLAARAASDIISLAGVFSDTWELDDGASRLMLFRSRLELSTRKEYRVEE